MLEFDQAGFDVEAARGITGDVDFSGEPVVALLVSVEDGVPAHPSADA